MQGSEFPKILIWILVVLAAIGAKSLLLQGSISCPATHEFFTLK